MDWSVYAILATKEAPAKVRDTATQVIAKQTAIYCSNKITAKKVMNWVPSVRKPAMK